MRLAFPVVIACRSTIANGGGVSPTRATPRGSWTSLDVALPAGAPRPETWTARSSRDDRSRFLSANQITVASQTDTEQTSEVKFLPEEDEEIIERLKHLGYIG